MAFKIGKNFHVIHMAGDVRELGLWYYDVFSVRQFIPESYMAAEKRDASLVLLGDLCIEPLAPAFRVEGWERMPLGRYYSQHGKRLHFFIGIGKAPVLEVEIARLFNEALQFHSTAPIAVLFAQGGQGGFDRFAVLACRFFLRLRLDHARFEKRQNEGKLLFALGLSP